MTKFAEFTFYALGWIRAEREEAGPALRTPPLFIEIVA
jgi:hypothetical protein